MSRPDPLLGMSPLQRYLLAERGTMDEISLSLSDAAASAQRRINKLETIHGIGSTVRRSQMLMIKRELRIVQEELWKEVGKRVVTGSTDVSDAASDAEAYLQELLFRWVGEKPPHALVQAQREYARATVRSYLARGENGIGLSQRVYRTKQLAAGFVDRQINRVILRGGSWQELASAVRPMIDPHVRGGVSYAAKRLARTELNNAFHTTNIALAAENPWVEGTKWNLSRSHPRRDRCDDLASDHSRGKPAGVYQVGQTPSKPHPQCLCFITEQVMDQDQFLDSLASMDLTDLAKRYRSQARSA